MLRKKLLLVLGSVVALILSAAVVAVLLLQSVLGDLEHFAAESFAGTSSSMAVQQHLTGLEISLERSMTDGGAVDGPEFLVLAADIRRGLAQIGQLEAVQGATAPRYAELVDSAEALDQRVQAVAKVGTLQRDQHDALLQSTSVVRAQLTRLQEEIQMHAQAEEQRTTLKFRWVALGLGLAFVLVINASIMVLSRMTVMILRPVDQLVAASRRMAREDFDYRVELPQQDEFGELAQAYNSMAAQLQVNEQRKVETLHHVARMLNHELNNAIAIIQLQLDRTARASQGDRIQAEPLREIQQALSRMTGIVSALTRVRRIVLTDYLSGLKMLDLEASVAEESSMTPPAATAHLVQHAGPS
jgi:methyl-accepting chemotaxis protein